MPRKYGFSPVRLKKNECHWYITLISITKTCINLTIRVTWFINMNIKLLYIYIHTSQERWDGVGMCSYTREGNCVVGRSCHWHGFQTINPHLYLYLLKCVWPKHMIYISLERSIYKLQMDIIYWSISYLLIQSCMLYESNMERGIWTRNMERIVIFCIIMIQWSCIFRLISQNTKFPLFCLYIIISTIWHILNRFISFEVCHII